MEATAVVQRGMTLGPFMVEVQRWSNFGRSLKVKPTG